jgi:3-carboxy-cis,cis-muconate cycloisomerase
MMMALAPDTGRQSAHDLIYAACRQAVETDRSLYDILSETGNVVDLLGQEKLKRLTTPGNYLGAAGEMVDRVLAKPE